MSLSETHDRAAKIDPAKGYRIHLFTLKDSPLLPNFEQASKIYKKEKGLWRLDSPDLQDREIYTVKTLDDLLALMRKGDAARLKDSVVILGTKPPRAWDDYFIDLSSGQVGEDALVRLHRALGHKSNGVEIPTAFFWQAAETKRIDHWHEVWVKGSDVTARTSASGKATLKVVPELYMEYMRPLNKSWFTINEGDTYFVTGMATIGFHNGKTKTDTIRITVNTPDAFRKMTHEELTATPQRQATQKTDPNAVPAGLLPLFGE